MKRSKNPLLWFGIVFLGALVVFAIFGPFARYDYLERVGVPHLPPSSQFWLGTDEQGRDVVARLAYGARVSLLIGFSVQLLALVTGITLGVLGVYGPSWLRNVILRFTDGMFAFPDILLAILIIGVWSSGVLPVVAALAITAWPSVVRLVRTQVATLKDREFVVATEALGFSRFYVVTRHVLPHLTGVLLAVSMVDLAGIILAESALSFLGIGIQPPTPSWGSIMSTGRNYVGSAWWIATFPGICLFLLVLSVNICGDHLRDRFDPRATIK